MALHGQAADDGVWIAQASVVVPQPVFHGLRRIRRGDGRSSQESLGQAGHLPQCALWHIVIPDEADTPKPNPGTRVHGVDDAHLLRRSRRARGHLSAMRNRRIQIAFVAQVAKDVPVAFVQQLRAVADGALQGNEGLAVLPGEPGEAPFPFELDLNLGTSDHPESQRAGGLIPPEIRHAPFQSFLAHQMAVQGFLNPALQILGIKGLAGLDVGPAQDLVHGPERPSILQIPMYLAGADARGGARVNLRHHALAVGLAPDGDLGLRVPGLPQKLPGLIRPSLDPKIPRADAPPQIREKHLPERKRFIPHEPDLGHRRPWRQMQTDRSTIPLARHALETIRGLDSQNRGFQCLRGQAAFGVQPHGLLCEVPIIPIPPGNYDGQEGLGLK